MDRSHPSEPDGKSILSQTEQPVAERFGTGVDGGAGAGFCAVRSKSDAASEKRGAPPPLRRGRKRGAVGKKCRGGWTDQRVNGVPDGVDIGNFIAEKFNYIKC